MFDRIAPRYDSLNRLLSLGRDRAWRRRMKRYLPEQSGLRVLDLATGTADQLLCLADDPRVVSGIGMDRAVKMLDIGRAKIKQRGLDRSLTLKEGDAVSIPAEDASADVVTMTFGIRNVLSVTEALSEMRRVLKPGGRALILEFSMPENTVVRWWYLLYLRHIIPRVGSVLSGDVEAYRYLNKTVEKFPYGAAFCEMMYDAGFQSVQAHPLTLGVVTMYQGDKS